MNAPRAFVLLALSTLCMLSSACGDWEAEGLKPGFGRLLVENTSSDAIHRVYISSVSVDEWGDDCLGTFETIEPGEMRGWQMPRGRYHVKCELEGGQVLDSLEEYSVREGEDTPCVVFDQGEGVVEPTSAPATWATGTLRVVNDSSRTIHYVNFSLTHDENWGEDRLGGNETIVPGYWREWGGVPVGRYNVRIEFADGSDLDSLEVYSVEAGATEVCTVYDD